MGADQKVAVNLNPAVGPELGRIFRLICNQSE